MTTTTKQRRAKATPVLVAAPPVLAPFLSAAARVVIAIDACCDVAPQTIAAQHIYVLPHTVHVGRRTVTLDHEHTLHPGCWPNGRQRIQPHTRSFSDVAQFYNHALDSGVSVLSLHMPSPTGSTVQAARTLRGILLAGPSSVTEQAPRVAICELAAIGTPFAFLVQAAAQAAAAGMTLAQLLTFLERLQATTESYYLTAWKGPRDALQHHARAQRKGVGVQQLWSFDQPSKRLQHRLRGAVTPHLFAPGGVLHEHDALTVTTTSERLLRPVNSQRARLQLAALEAQPAGGSLRYCFPHGCVEFAMLPNQAHITYMIDVIQRIDRAPTTRVRGVRARGGLA